MIRSEKVVDSPYRHFVLGRRCFQASLGWPDLLECGQWHRRPTPPPQGSWSDSMRLKKNIRNLLPCGWSGGLVTWGPAGHVVTRFSRWSPPAQWLGLISTVFPQLYDSMLLALGEKFPFALDFSFGWDT